MTRAERIAAIRARYARGRNVTVAQVRDCRASHVEGLGAEIDRLEAALRAVAIAVRTEHLARVMDRVDAIVREAHRRRGRWRQRC